MLVRREQFVAGPGATEAGAALARHLADVLAGLGPELLGAYWRLGSEFNAALALAAGSTLAKLPNPWPMALPFAQRAPVCMHYRSWDGTAPTVVDECGISSGSGAAALPDVVLVPCVGFTAAGFRLGYGAGYFDRWLAEHRDVTAVGVAWAVGQIDAGAYEPQPHDMPMTLIVTERGVV